jgi:hypothetical protein
MRARAGPWEHCILMGVGATFFNALADADKRHTIMYEENVERLKKLNRTGMPLGRGV